MHAQEKHLDAENGGVLLKGQTYLVYCGKICLGEPHLRGCLSPKSVQRASAPT